VVPEKTISGKTRQSLATVDIAANAEYVGVSVKIDRNPKGLLNTLYMIADHGAIRRWPLQAVAHSDARWFALNREAKLPAAAGGASDGHGSPLSLFDIGGSVSCYAMTASLLKGIT
jgi:hypothetical protein